MNKTLSYQEIEKQIRSRDFDEVKPCELCGGTEFKGEFHTKDKCRIVSCKNCELWFTSPRLDESLWNRYLTDPGNESIKNLARRRRKYGVALERNIPKNPNHDWRKRIKDRHETLFDEFEKILGRKVEALHDVGSGIGFLLEDAGNRGIKASGNEMNRPACEIMQEEYELDVKNCSVEECNLLPESFDAISMSDVIEHVYHPMSTLKEAYKALKKGGVLYVETFIIDCPVFDELREDWNFLYWNHVTHFSTETLQSMISKAGFSSIQNYPSNREHIIKLFAVK